MGIRENLSAVQDALQQSCRRAGRSPDEVRLMAVSKTHPAAAVREAHAAGQRLFGENRVQEMQGKAADLAGLDGLEVHLIGPLQSNKTARAAKLFQGIDAVDSGKIAKRLNTAAAALKSTLPVLVEVKLSPEESKHGIPPEDLLPLLQAIAGETHLHLAGLMTVPPLDAAGEAARPYFRRLREIRDTHQQDFPSLTELSMGMSGDFEVAIEEGATTVRLGTAIFGRRGTR